MDSSAVFFHTIIRVVLLASDFLWQVPDQLDGALEAIKIAHLYAVHPLISLASESVKKLTDVTTAVRVWAYAVGNLPFSAGRAVASHAATVVLGAFDQITRKRQLGSLADPCFELLVCSNDLVVASETTVLQEITKRYMTARTPAERQVCVGWWGHVRWGQLPHEEMARRLQYVSSAAGSDRVPWIKPTTDGLLHALSTFVDNGEARLRPANFPRGGTSPHTIEIAVTLKGGDAEQVSEPLVVAADNWRLVVKARDSGKTNLSDFVPIALQRDAACPVAEAAGVQSAAVVCVTASLYTFSLQHARNGNRSAPGYQSSVNKHCRGCGNYNCRAASRTEELRRPEAPTLDDASTGTVQAVFFTEHLRIDGNWCCRSGLGSTVRAVEGRIGVGISFSVAVVQDVSSD